MRIHRLEIASFGPFAGREEIDFDALAEHGLFLLNGPTGAGKTSILDAICFALYGSLPGARQGTRSLKSHHAASDAEPAVVLEFTAKGRRFEVRRTPEWSKPSRRSANGWTAQKASTHVRELVGGDWRALTSRNDEAGSLLLDVLGMAKEQFTRVVLLPQGEFSAFLRSKASDRVALLEKLFATHRYADVEAQLAGLARHAQDAQAEALRSALLPLAQLGTELEGPGLAGVASELLGGDDPPLWRRDTIDVDSTRHLFATAQLACEAAAADLDEEVRTASEKLESVRSAAQSAARLADDAAELSAARRRHAAWQEAAAQHTERASTLAAHRRAVSLRPHIFEADRTSADHRHSVRVAAAALEAAHAAGWAEPAGLPDARLSDDGLQDHGLQDHVLPDHGLPDLSEVRAAAAAAAAEAAVLADRLPAEREIEGLAAREERERAELARLAAEEKGQIERMSDVRSGLQELGTERARLEPIAAGLAVARLDVDAAKATVAAVEEHAAAALEVGRRVEEHGQARRGALDSKQRWLDLREQRLDQTAAELASQLLPGEACQVCGSRQHPAPARSAQDPLLLVDAERSAAREAERWAAQERRTADAVARARELLAGIDARGGSMQPDKAGRALDEALGVLAQAEQASTRLATTLAGLDRLGGESEETAQAVDATRAARVRAHDSHAALVADLERRRAEVEGWRHGFDSVAARLADVSARARTLEALAQSLTACRAAEASAGHAHGALQKALADTSFGTVDAARDALLPDPEAASLEALSEAYTAEGKQIEGLFESAALRRALEAEQTGCTVSAEEAQRLHESAHAAEEDLRRAHLHAEQVRASMARVRRLAASFEAAVPPLEAAGARADMLSELLRTVRGSGENSLRMSLHSYVLAARLEQVALAATERLQAMSEGRFSIQHSDALAARGASSGLGLEILDGWTGQRRDPSTLSGGETFMASLALALGLADVVQHESGGIDIETLFVDEGFGSLDDQALEQVMDAIEGLRAGGRVVGLVSHVAELKQRVGAQIRVAKGRAGSHVSLVGTAGL